MSKKKLKQDGIYFTGKAADDVTGSQYLVQFGGYKCLLECGLHQSQSNNYLDSYKINSEKFKFKATDIDFIFVAHPHIDHCGLIPRLVKEGFRGKIITTKNTALVMKSLLLNSCYIVYEEARILSKKFHREYKPLYTESDVYTALNLIVIYDDYNTIYKLNDTISFQWLQNSHCLGAAQLQLILSSKNKKKKVLYTSDIGALHTKNHFLQDTEIPTMFNDIVIMESTYGDVKRGHTKTRKFDIEHIKSAINTVTDRNGIIIFPCFSFSRTQEILVTLYEIFGKDKNFSIPIIIDSKLSCEICSLYKQLLSGINLTIWEEICNWANLKFVEEKELSKQTVIDDSSKIIISSSGFCTNGRVVNYLKKYLKDPNSMIVFSGYTGDNPSYLSYRIKNYRENKYISINKEKVLNKADCIVLSTFSSHADNNDLITYGSSLNTNKLILVHGSSESKKNLSSQLNNAISKNDKTYKVVSAFKDMIIHL